jgi:hypothetical protein
MTRNVCFSYVNSLLLMQKIILNGPPLDANFYQSNEQRTGGVTVEADKDEAGRRTRHHGLYGGRINGSTPYVIASPPSPLLLSSQAEKDKEG